MNALNPGADPQLQGGGPAIPSPAQMSPFGATLIQQPDGPSVTALIGAEPNLGKPPVTGYVLTSTTAGARSWAAPGAALWGGIGGTLSNQTDLQTALNGKVGTGTTVNGHALTGNISLTYTDVGAQVAGSYENPLTFNAPLTRSTNAISITQSSGSANGYLSSTDWNTFNGKQSTLTFSQSVLLVGSTVTLVGDSGAPGNSKYYGSDSSGNVGYHTLPSGIGDALTTNPLSQFAATTSAQLASVLTGVATSGTSGGYVRSAGGALSALTGLGIRSTGAAFDLTLASSEVLTAGRTLSFVVSNTSPTLTLTGSPSISGVTITGSGTIAIGTKSPTFSNSITFAGTDSTTMTFPSTSATIARTDAANSFTGNQTLASGALLLWSTDVALARNAAGVLEVDNGTAGQWGAVKAGVRDSATGSVANGLILGHQSTGTPAANFGSGILFNANSSTTADQNAAQIAAAWSIATHASRTSYIDFQAVNSAASLASVARLFASGGFSVNSTTDPGAGIINAATAFQINNAGTAGQVLRGDGAKFVSAVLGAADLSNGVSGSGAVILATSPTLITPTLGVATATSINKWGFTAPSTSCTLVSGADGLTYTFPDITSNIGFRELPINNPGWSGNYTTILTDNGKCILHPTTDNNARTVTIDTSTVSYLAGTCITFINMKNTLTISMNSGTMTQANTSNTGNRTLAVNGIATVIILTTSPYTALINGNGLT